MVDNLQENLVLKLGPASNNQVLYLFGARHSNDSTDSQFIKLKQFWNEFLDNTKNERVVFTEGPARDIPTSYEEAIQQRGEVGATQWLAKQLDVSVICPEPDSTEQRKSLCLIFDPQIVVYAFIAQNLSAWFRQATHKSNFPEAIKRSLEREAKFSEIFGFMPDTAWLDKQHRKLFGDQQLEDKDFLGNISDPRKNDTLVNNVVSNRTKMRNEYIQKYITTEWKSGKNIFMVYGKGHFEILRPVLIQMVSN